MGEHVDNESDPGTGDDMRDLLALVAVHGLDPIERASFYERLGTHPERAELEAELAEFQETIASWAESVAEAPPDGLRDRVMAAAFAADEITDPDAHTAGTATTTSDRSATSSTGDVAEPARTEGDAEPARTVPFAPRRQRWVRVALAAAAAAIIAVAGITIVERTGDHESDQVADVVEAPGATVIALHGELNGLRLVHDPSGERMAIVGEAVAAPDGESVYELWLMRGETPERVEIFRPNDDGTVAEIIPDMTPPTDASFAVTVEPAGGTSAPTGPIVASSDTSS